MIKFYKEWKKFKKKQDANSRNILISQYLYLAKYVASTVPRFSSLYDYHDLVGWACIGLIEAIERFDPEKGTKFETFAISRIRGAVLDNLRKVAKSVHSSKKREVSELYRKLQLKLGRPPEEFEMADALGISNGEYRKLLKQMLPLYIISLESLIVKGRGDKNIYEKFIQAQQDSGYGDNRILAERKLMLADAIKKLSGREKEIIMLYYYEGLTMKEISGVLRLSQGRVSQILSSALMRLGQELKARIK